MVCEAPPETECAPPPAQVCLPNEVPVCVDSTTIDTEVAAFLVDPLIEIAGLTPLAARSARFTEIQEAHDSLVLNVFSDMSSGAIAFVSEDEAHRLVEESFRILTGFAYNDILRDVFEEPDESRFWNVPLQATVSPVATSTGAVDTNPPTNVTISPISAGTLPQITLTAGAGSFAAGSKITLFAGGEIINFDVTAQVTTFTIPADSSRTLTAGQTLSFFYQAPGTTSGTAIGPVMTVVP